MATTEKRSGSWRPAFLESLRKCGNVTVAAKAAGINRVTAHKAYSKSKLSGYHEFADAWDDALDEAIDTLEEEARRRAQDGIEKAIYHQGEVVGKELTYSDTLMIFLLKAHRPDKYRERYGIEHSGDLTVRTLADVAKEAAE